MVISIQIAQKPFYARCIRAVWTRSMLECAAGCFPLHTIDRSRCHPSTCINEYAHASGRVRIGMPTRSELAALHADCLRQKSDGCCSKSQGTRLRDRVSSVTYYYSTCDMRCRFRRDGTLRGSQARAMPLSGLEMPAVLLSVVSYRCGCATLACCCL